MPGATKKSAAKKKTVARTGTFQSNNPLLNAQKLLVAVVVFGVVGVALLILTKAATTGVNCTNQVSPSGSTMAVCVNMGSTGSITANAAYAGKTSSTTLVAASLSLYACTTPDLKCSTVAASTTIKKSSIFTPNKSTVATTGVANDKTKAYKACLTSTDKSGWQLSNVCTNVITFGNGTAQVYTAPVTTTQSVTPACGGVTVTKADGSKWACSFSDEFDGTSLNRSLWVAQTTAKSGFATTDTGDGNTRACFMDSPRNISVSGGYLNLSVNKESSTFNCSGGKVNFNTQYTAGQVMTYNLFSQTYGRFEVRAKLPTYDKKGLQETFWLWPNDQFKYGAWPGSGEIDFAEFYSQYYNYNVPYIHYNYSSYDTATNKNIVTLLSPSYNKNYYNCAINYGDFNTYTAVWSPGYIELDVNGKPCVIDNYTASNAASPAPFDQPFFLALTQALGIKAGNQDNAFVPGVTPAPATTQIDYVRIWK